MQLKLLIICILVMTGLLSGCTDYNIHTISYDSAYVVIVDNNRFGTITISLDVLEGGNVDFFLVTESEYDNYKANRETYFFPDGSELNTTKTKKSLNIGGDWYVVIVDNTYFPKGGADPIGDVKIELTIW